MARTHSKPGPKPQYSERRDYHIPLSLELANAIETLATQESSLAGRRKSVIATVEAALRRDAQIIAIMAEQKGNKDEQRQ